PGARWVAVAGAASAVLVVVASAAGAGVSVAAVSAVAAAASAAAVPRGAGEVARMQRLLANLFEGWFQLRRRFPAALLDEITAAIAAGEHTHQGEVCVAIESRLDPF